MSTPNLTYIQFIHVSNSHNNLDLIFQFQLCVKKKLKFVLLLIINIYVEINH